MELLGSGADKKPCPEEEDVEAICHFFNTIGKQLDENPKSRPNLVHTHQKSLAIFFGSFLSPLPTARARSYLATAAAAALSPLLAHRLEIDHLARRRR